MGKAADPAMDQESKNRTDGIIELEINAFIFLPMFLVFQCSLAYIYTINCHFPA